MKKICIVLAGVLLAGGLYACGEGTPSPAPAPEQSSAVPSQQAPRQIDSVEYTIEKKDQSIRDDDGNVLVEWYYDQVVLSGSDPAVQSINENIEDNAKAFLAPEQGEEFESNAKQGLKSGILDPSQQPYHSWFHTAGAQVTQNADGVFSIKMTSGWYMGGVLTQDYHGLNYDLHTGKPAKLTDLLSEDESTLFTKLKTIVTNYMNDDPGRFPSREGLDAYKYTNDFDFYIKDGEIVLLFPTYELGPGVAGPTVIETGLSIQASQD